MRTPDGKECSYFYGNYYRGRRQEECRLIGNVPPPGNWTPDLCKTCPVPGIQHANSCSDLVLHAEVKSLFLGFRRRVKVNSYCLKSKQNVPEPEIGCGQCHPSVNEVFDQNQ